MNSPEQYNRIENYPPTNNHDCTALFDLLFDRSSNRDYIHRNAGKINDVFDAQVVAHDFAVEAERIAGCQISDQLRTRLSSELTIYFLYGYDYVDICGRVAGPIDIRYTGRSLLVTDIDQEIVYKAILPCIDNDKGRMRLGLEIWSAAKICRPDLAVPQIYEPLYNFEGKLIGYSAELIHGMPLNDKIRANYNFDNDKTLTMLKALCDVLDSLHVVHQMGIIHRDIKPANIIHGSDDRGYLIDFNMARDTNIAPISQHQSRVGTEDYMPPEIDQLMGNVDHRADLFSLGLTIFDVIYGHSRRNSTLVLDSINKWMHPHQPIPSSASKWTHEFLSRATAKNPDNRFQSAAEMKTALLTFMNKIKEYGI